MRKHENRLTERKMRDKRFYATERAILGTCCCDWYGESSGRASVNQMSRAIGISKSTFYRHHAAVNFVMRDYEDFMIRRCKRYIRENFKGDAKMAGAVRVGRRNEKVELLKQLYRRVLFFMLQNKEVFQILLADERSQVVKEMVNVLRVQIVGVVGGQDMAGSKDVACGKNAVGSQDLCKALDNGLWNSYAAAVAELINAWGRDGFYEERMQRVVSDVLWLTGVMGRSKRL